MRTLTRPHYAWIICLGGALAFCTGMGLVANLFALCLPDIILELELSKAQGSWLTTIRALFSLLSMFVVNQLCARFGLRQVMTFGAGLVGISYLLLSRADSFFACCFACALLGISYCLCGPVPVSLLVGKWFDSRRGLAIGLSSAGSGVVTILVPPILTRILVRFGLSCAFLVLGILGLVLGAALWLLIRNQPEDLGLLAYKNGCEAKAPRVQNVPTPMTPVQKGAVLLASFLMAAPAGPGFAHVAVFFRSEGYTELLVAALMSVLGFVLLVGKILCGQIYDRAGGRLGNLYTFAVLLAGHGLFLLAPAGLGWLAFVSIAVYGLGMPISSVSTTRWAADLNSEENYPAAVRAINLAYSFGTLLFGPVPGLLADRFESYLPTYALFGFLLILSFGLLRVVYGQLGVGTRR